LQERGLIGLEARAADGTEIGRIAEVVADEEGAEVTYIVVETEGGERLEVPITGLSLDPDADFATFVADASDEEPGDHTGDEAEPEDDYAPDDLDDEAEEDYEHEGQLVTEPEDQDEAQTEADLEAREDWEDETYTPDSGYPRNDVYVDPDTGEEVDPSLQENEGLEEDVADLLDGTNLPRRRIWRMSSVRSWASTKSSRSTPRTLTQGRPSYLYPRFRPPGALRAPLSNIAGRSIWRRPP
jgi:hypothetical protein